MAFDAKHKKAVASDTKLATTMVRERRLELPRRLTHAPQTCLSTYSSTLAYSPMPQIHLNPFASLARHI